MKSVGGAKIGDPTLLKKQDCEIFGAHPGVTEVRPDRGGWRGNTDGCASIEEVADIAAIRDERAAEITPMTREIGR
jgi:hypothetical protein